MRKMLWIVVVVVILGVAGVGAVIWFGNQGKPVVKQETTNSGGTKTAVIIQTKTNSSFGKYLADGNGNTLYTYSSDTNGVSNCSGACLYSWPVYEATTTSSLPANVTVIARSDGSKQYAYKGMPLYGFSGDSVGEIRGDGLSGFHVAKP